MNSSTKSLLLTLKSSLGAQGLATAGVDRSSSGAGVGQAAGAGAGVGSVRIVAKGELKGAGYVDVRLSPMVLSVRHIPDTVQGSLSAASAAAVNPEVIPAVHPAANPRSLDAPQEVPRVWCGHRAAHHGPERHRFFWYRGPTGHHQQRRIPGTYGSSPRPARAGYCVFLSSFLK